jgi:hypothetical protein
MMTESCHNWTLDHCIDSTMTTDPKQGMRFVPTATLECAVNNRCVPCLYKICCNGSTDALSSTRPVLHLPPNVRPELCPRSRSILSKDYSGLYKAPPSECRVLTVGDGDLSFSLSIAKYFYDFYGSARNVVATTHESYDSVCTTYKDGKKHIDLLAKTGAQVYHRVDATNLVQTLKRKPARGTSVVDQHFHFVLWNFPCIRIEKGADGQVSELDQNKQLIRQFFANVEPYLVPDNGEVHLAHKTIEPFSWWGVEDIAKEEHFDCLRRIVFDK